MKVVIAPDSFKGSLSAVEACAAMRDGVAQVNPAMETVLVPMADGGEGTAACLVAATGGRWYVADATDPLGRPVTAGYGVLGDGVTCVLDVASASGLTLLDKSELDPLRTSSHGTGLLLRDALEKGYRRFLVGLGGSATNDMGVGILQALGATILDSAGVALPPGGAALASARTVDLTTLDSRLAQAQITIACDVTNPLVGKAGASAVFGPQKGAAPAMVEQLDAALHHFADVLQGATGRRVHDLAGAGAAGGIGGMFMACLGARMEPGVALVMKAVGLAEKLAGASLVLTGEGRMDAQTRFGKVPYGVAQLAKRACVPTVALVGSLDPDVYQQPELGLNAVFSIVPGPMAVTDAIADAYGYTRDCAAQVMRVYSLGAL